MFVYQVAKAIEKYMKNYGNKKEPSWLQYWVVNDLYCWAMPPKVPVNNLEWIKDTSWRFHKKL